MSYQEVLDRIEDACARSGRDPSAVTLVAVSKTKSVDEIMDIYEQGHRDFGENRAQELAVKAPALPSDIRWHFVGALQSNKARVVRPVAHLLHSMDRVSLAAAWLKGMGDPPRVLVQVNTGDEPQKAGVGLDEVEATVASLENMGITVAGLMAIPPIPDTPEESRDHFVTLRESLRSAASQHPSLVELSMGMTDDFEVAIEEGASIIRVGRAIFGDRN